MDIEQLKQQYKEKVDKITDFAIKNYNKPETFELLAEFDSLLMDWIIFFNIKVVPTKKEEEIKCFISDDLSKQLTPDIQNWIDKSMDRYRDRYNKINFKYPMA